MNTSLAGSVRSPGELPEGVNPMSLYGLYLLGAFHRLRRVQFGDTTASLAQDVASGTRNLNVPHSLFIVNFVFQGSASNADNDVEVTQLEVVGGDKFIANSASWYASQFSPNTAGEWVGPWLFEVKPNTTIAWNGTNRSATAQTIKMTLDGWTYRK
jgi:hypothetical protein